MATGVLGVAARQDPRQVTNTLKKTTNWNDVGIATGVAFNNFLPQGAFILRVLTQIVTPFNAATTNVYTVGTVGAGFNNIVSAGDVNEAVAGVYESTGALGQSLALAGPVAVTALYTQTGTAASAGQAVTVIAFEGGWST